MGRWLKFNAVGIIGAGVQIAALSLLLKVGVHYLIATAIAVECAVLHNYFWHVRWTWKDRPGSIWRFHLANGLVSILSNLFWMRIFAGWLGFDAKVSNLIAICLTSIANFLLGHHWVFANSPKRSERRFHGVLE